MSTAPLPHERHPFGRLIGLEMAAWGDDQSVCRLPVTPTLHNQATGTFAIFVERQWDQN